MEYPSAFILPGCPAAPNLAVCGLPRRERLERSLRKKGFRILSDPGKAGLKIPDCRILIGDETLHLCEEGIPSIENRLLLSLRKPVEVDGIVCALLTRRFSLALTRRLMNFRITPNQVTVLTILLGIASGAVIAFGGYGNGVWGALLLQGQGIFDCVDGELARLKFQGSRLGEWLDTVSDDLAEFSFLAGMTVAVSVPWLRWLGILALVAFVAGKAVIYHALVTVYHTGDLLAFRWDFDSNRKKRSKLPYLFKHDFLCFLFLILALFGRLDIALFLGSGGAILFFATLLRQLVRRGLKTAPRLPEGERM